MEKIVIYCDKCKEEMKEHPIMKVSAEQQLKNRCNGLYFDIKSYFIQSLDICWKCKKELADEYSTILIGYL